MTHSYVWHDSFICVTWLIHMCDMTHSYVWHDSFICVTWFIHRWCAPTSQSARCTPSTTLDTGLTMRPPRYVQKEPYIPWNEPYIPWNEPYIPWKEPYIPWKEPYIPWKEPYILWKEPYIPWKEPYTLWKEPLYPALNPVKRGTSLTMRPPRNIKKARDVKRALHFCEKRPAFREKSHIFFGKRPTSCGKRLWTHHETPQVCEKSRWFCEKSPWFREETLRSVERALYADLHSIKRGCIITMRPPRCVKRAVETVERVLHSIKRALHSIQRGTAPNMRPPPQVCEKGFFQ